MSKVTLLLRLAAPMQSWGMGSKFDIRRTNLEPTRSGVIGLLAAAGGLSREDSLKPFYSLNFGVRIDQLGTVQRDFHMVHGVVGSNKSLWLTHRYYIEDAVFLAGVEGEKEFVLQLEEALHHPAYPLFLGRRSCPPAMPLSLGIRDKKLKEALGAEDWQAAAWYQKKALYKNGVSRLEIVRDAEPEEDGYAVRDVPESFSQTRRLYQFRNVVREQIPLAKIVNEQQTCIAASQAATDHDPMSLLEDYDVSIKSQD